MLEAEPFQGNLIGRSFAVVELMLRRSQFGIKLHGVLSVNGRELAERGLHSARSIFGGSKTGVSEEII